MIEKIIARSQCFQYLAKCSTILVTNLETLVWFSAPQCWFGFAVISVLQNTLGSTLGKEIGHIWVRTKVWRVNVRNLEKIQDKWLLFQRFVKSIVASTSLKIKKISVQPRSANSALQAKLRPLFYPLLEPFEHNLDQKSSIKRLLQPTHAFVVVHPNNSNESLSGRMTTHAMPVHLQANYSSA